MRPKIIPIQKFENKFDGGESMYTNNNICNGKNKDSFQNDEWNWKMVGSIAINNNGVFEYPAKKNLKILGLARLLLIIY